MSNSAQELQPPLLRALLKYKQENIYPFHTPGHKGGRGTPDFLKNIWGEFDLGAEVSLMDELDDIHYPTDCLRDSMRMAAETYGADETLYAVNGTTMALQAMILGTLSAGEKILIPRNAHRSVLSAVVLGKLEVVYLDIEWNDDFAISMQVTLRTIEQAFNKHKNIKAVLLTSPNYYGVLADVRAIADYVHNQHAFLLVDEAHGAHLGFCKNLPASALSLGADAVCQSTHKSLSAWSQCSVLHLRYQKNFPVEKIRLLMSLLTTTSPNYFLLVSLEMAIWQMKISGTSLIEKAYQNAKYLRSEIKKIPRLKLLSTEDVTAFGGLDLDITKITINVSGANYNGQEAGDFLRARKFAVELVDAQNILLLLTFADSKIALENVSCCLQELASSKINSPTNNIKILKLPPIKNKMLMQEALFADNICVGLAEAVGFVAAETVAFYPPGIPVILPGEIITEELVFYCQKMCALGIAVHSSDKTLQTIKIVRGSME